MKLFRGLITILVLFCSSVFFPYHGEAQESSPAGEFKWTKTDGKITITWYSGTGGVVRIPPVIDGCPVVAIGPQSFLSKKHITSIIIPDSVVSIGSTAFYDCTNLTSVFIGGSVSSISWKAFAGCTNLNAIDVSQANDRYTSINGILFSKDATELILYPPQKKAVSYDVPSSVTSISDRAFFGCQELAVVSLPPSVRVIGEHAFSGCRELSTFTIPDSVVAVKKGTFEGCLKLGSVTIPPSVTKIGARAFCLCRLEAIVLPNSVVSIGGDAFRENPRLTRVVIPASVKSIGVAAFWFCGSLVSISVAADNSRYASVDGVLFTKDLKRLICYPSSRKADYYAVPPGVLTIEDCAFRGTAFLVKISLPASTTSIGAYAFEGSRSLSSIIIPSGLESIGESAFEFCFKLTRVSIEGRTGLILPRLGNSSVFGDNAATRVILVPPADVMRYKADRDWSRYAGSIEVNP